MTALVVGLFLKAYTCVPLAWNVVPSSKAILRKCSTKPRKSLNDAWLISKLGSKEKKARLCWWRGNAKPQNLSSCKWEVKQVNFHDLQWSFLWTPVFIPMSRTVHVVSCNISLGVTINGHGNFINRKCTFNCALDCMHLIPYCLNRQTVPWTFMGKLHRSESFVVFLFYSFYFEMSNNFIQLHQSEVWKSCDSIVSQSTGTLDRLPPHNMMEHKLVQLQHLTLCSGVKTQREFNPWNSFSESFW